MSALCYTCSCLFFEAARRRNFGIFRVILHIFDLFFVGGLTICQDSFGELDRIPLTEALV